MSYPALRACLFKAGYSAREINATMASYAKRGADEAIGRSRK